MKKVKHDINFISPNALFKKTNKWHIYDKNTKYKYLCCKFVMHKTKRKYHRRAVAQPCVNGDWLSKGRMAKFDPVQIRNPWTDRHKIWNTWLRRRDYPRAKFHANPSIGGFSANGWNITKFFFRYINFFCWPTYRSDRSADFHTR